MLKNIALGVVAFALMMAIYIVIALGFQEATPFLLKFQIESAGLLAEPVWVRFGLYLFDAALCGLFGGVAVTFAGKLFSESPRRGAWLAFLILNLMIASGAGAGLIFGTGYKEDWPTMIRALVVTQVVFAAWWGLPWERRQRRERKAAQ